jgi:hypothetical protein
VPNLSALKNALLIRVARWPHAELRIADDEIRDKPTSFKAGDRVTAFVTVQTISGEAARVRLFIAGSAECSDLGMVLAEVKGEIPAGQATAFRSEVRVPDLLRWWLRADAELMPVKQTIWKYEITRVSKGTAKPVGPGPFQKCSAGWRAALLLKEPVSHSLPDACRLASTTEDSTARITRQQRERNQTLTQSAPHHRVS